MDQRTTTRRIGAALLTLAIGATAAACGGAAVVSPANTPTVAPTAAATQPGPVDFAAWTERQGFGGTSGLTNVKKLAAWLTEHRYDVKVFDLDSDGGDVIGLIGWLDRNEPTACWADFHAAVRASLQKIADGYATVRVEVAAGHTAPEAPVAALFAESEAAFAMAAPANCP